MLDSGSYTFVKELTNAIPVGKDLTEKQHRCYDEKVEKSSSPINKVLYHELIVRLLLRLYLRAWHSLV